MTLENEALAESLTPAADVADAAPITDAQTAEAGPSEDEQLSATYQRLVTNNGSDRGEDGKFKSASSGDGEGAGEPAGPPSEATASAPAPANWNGLDDVWKAVPAEHQERVKTHFDDLHRRMSDQGRQLASLKPVADNLAEAAKVVPQFNGMAPQEITRRALELAAISVEMKRNPVDTLLKVAESTGSLALLKARLSGQEAPPAEQHIASLEQKIATLENRLKEASDPKYIETHVSQAFEGRAAQDAVNQFASDPANSFFADVEPHLPAFINIARETAQAGASAKDILKSAYDMAINAIPAIRTKAQAAAKPPVQLDPKRAEAAKKAASINVKSNATGGDAELSEQDALKAAYRRATAA